MGCSNSDMTPAISILILNWNKPALTSRLLQDLASQVQKKSVEVLVLDNGSTLPYPEWWKAMPNVRLLHSGTNVGYSGGMRLLIEQSRAPWLWLLNNDCRVPSNAVANAQRAVAAGNADVLFPIVLDPDGSIQSRDAHWNKVLTWRIGEVAKASGGAYPIFGDLFVGPLLRRKIVDALQILPATFHSYGEDFDACYCFALAAARCIREPAIKLTHQMSMSRPTELEERYRFTVQGARNLVVSVLLNYQWRTILWAGLPVFVKAWCYDLGWRQRASWKLLGSKGLRCWMGFPQQVLLHYDANRGIRTCRQSARVMSDSGLFAGRNAYRERILQFRSAAEEPAVPGDSAGEMYWHRR